MPYLNWKTIPAELKSASHPEYQTQLSLKLPKSELGVLATAIDNVLGQPGYELRVELPENWTIFFKPREGETRQLLAHPEQGVWVATVAFELAHGRSFVSRIQELAADGTVSVSRTGSVGRMGNFELEIGEKA